MSLLFDLIYLLPALVYAPIFFLKSRRAGENPGLLFSERWGCYASAKLAKFAGKKILWIHAVSVGEVMVARRLIDSLRVAQKTYHFVLTTVTPTGQKLARQSEASDLSAFYVPFDFSFCVQSFLKQIKPEALVLVETEIWPNLILISKKAKLPIFIVNARLSEKSLKGYKRVHFLFKSVFSAVTRVLAQDEVDGERFQQLGIPKSQVDVLGNIKFDTEVVKSDSALKRSEFGIHENDSVWIAGSTHPGEETKVIEVYLRARKNFKNLKLILAPRHVERVDGLLRELATSQLVFQRTSRFHVSEKWDVLIVDQLGILKNIYALGNFVFMGGSWIEHGGQNPIEPAVFNLPVLHGPHVFNFKQVYAVLNQAQGAFRVADTEDCFQKVELFLNDPRKAVEAGWLASETVKKYRGASAAQAKVVLDFLN